MVRAVAILCCSALSVARAQSEVDRYQRIERMHHTAWTARDGLDGEPSSLAQTTDGFLWVGTSDGLYRFDGIRFEAFRPASGVMAARAVSTLTAAPGGGLWVGHQSGGVTFIDANDRATTYSPADSLPVARVRAIVVDSDGTVWVAAVGGLARLVGGGGRQWQKIRTDWNYPHLSAWNVSVDKKGTLWVGAASPQGVMYLPRGARRFIRFSVDGSALGFRDLDDSTMVYVAEPDPTVHLVRRRGDSATMFQTIPDLPSSAIAIDGDRGIWVPGRGVMRFRMSSPKHGLQMSVSPIEQFTHENGLSGSTVMDVLVDREGTIWIATKEGLDRFRRRNLTWDPDSMVAGGGSVITGSDGRVWILSLRAPALRSGIERLAVPGAPAKLDNGYADRDGTLWLSDQQALFRWDGKRFTPVPPPKEVVDKNLRFTVVATTRDRSGRLWISVAGSGVFFRTDSSWTFKQILEGRPDMAPFALAADEQGRVWLAYRDEVAVVEGDRVRLYRAADGLDITPFTSVRVGGGHVWVTGERGFALLHGGGDRFQAVNASHSPGAGLGVVTGAVPTQDGLWLTTTTGIAHLTSSEVERLSADPAAPVRIERFDQVSDLPDAMRYAARVFRWATEAGDGVLWVVTQNGIAKVDPRQIVRNQLPPLVSFRSVSADDSTFSPRGEIRLPPRTRTLRIEYTALSMVIPERVRFRHRLEGWETDWHEADDRREVTYTDLRPGDYSFQLTASNNDGVWNDTGAILQFSVAPAWFQTVWFRALVIAALIGAVIALYRLRIRQVAAALAVRFDERLAERTRIARELHDTLLQTVQGSKIVADDALDNPNDTDRLRDAMRRVSGWLGQASAEGRAALNSLRVTGAERDLADALRRAADDPTRPKTMIVSIDTHGSPRPLHPVVEAEIYRIGLEGIHNACRHSGATRLNVELEYGHNLVLTMTDNGVGVDPAMLDGGKLGRFGIRGMRERAANIGGILTIEPTNPGTRVTLVVPGPTVFQAPASR